MKKKLALGCLTIIIIPIIALAILGYLVFHRVEGEYFDSNGARIHYTVEGQGEPLILIHGVAANADLNWRRTGITRRLARHFQVIAFDCRAHGLSDQPDDPDMYGMEMVEDIGRLLDHLDIETAHMAGYSMGGFLLLKYMTTHPERVRSAAFCASGWKDPDDPSAIPSPYKKPWKKKKKAEPEAQPVKKAMAIPGTMAIRETFDDIVGWCSSRLNNKGAIHALKKSYPQWIVTKDEIENNKVPSVCFIGTEDGLLSLAEDLHKHMANLEYVLLDGPNHFTLPFSSDFKHRLTQFFLDHRTET